MWINFDNSFTVAFRDELHYDDGIKVHLPINLFLHYLAKCECSAVPFTAVIQLKLVLCHLFMANISH